MLLIIIILSGFLFSLLFTAVIRKQAIKRSIVDIPNHRSSHDVPTPRGGGLAIAVSWYVGIVVLWVLGKIESQILIALLGGLPLFVISLIDDIKDLSARLRMLFQALSAGIGTLAIFYTKLLNFGNPHWFLWLVFAGVAFVAVIWFINLFNFLDGLDGYLGVETVFVFLAFYLFSGQSFLLLMVGATVGFLFWNWPKAKIFCGDVGSTLIGYNVAIIALWLQTSEQVSIVVPLIITALFWGDASYTLIRRFLNKERISQAHRKHAYQRLNQSGFSHLQVLFVAIGFNLILFVLAGLLFMEYLNASVAVVLLILALAGYLGFVNKRKAFENS